MNRHARVASDEQVAQVTLSELLLQAAQGDPEAFATFYQQTSQRVFGLTRRIIVDPEIAQDVTQQIYLMVWQTAHKYVPATGSAMAWLMTIAHHRAVDEVRSEQAHTRRETRWGITNQNVDYDVVAETVANRIENQLVARCLRDLSALQHEAITLAYYNCLTYREVGAQLSIPLSTAKSRIRDGLKQLRACMDGY